jgi:hypothetical protein
MVFYDQAHCLRLEKQSPHHGRYCATWVLWALYSAARAANKVPACAWLVVGPACGANPDFRVFNYRKPASGLGGLIAS